MNISLLIDTNVAIQLEEAGTDGEIKGSFALLHSQVLKHKISVLIHPISVEDVKNDKNEARKKTTLSRLNKYPFLQSPPTPVGNQLEELFGGLSKTNDVVDANILFAVYKNCVTYLVTEDLGLHKRAKNSGLDDRVLSVAEALDCINRTYEPSAVHFPAIREEYTYNIDINDPIFDSLKEDYDEFVQWYQKKCCEKQRKAWIIEADNRLAGICIYKHDDTQEHSGIDLPSMKLATFKVSDDFKGAKYGELLLKMALGYAYKNGIKTIWVTARPKQIVLIQFLKDFGFSAHSELAGEDMIFYKQLFVPNGTQSMPPLEFHIKFSPHYLDHKHINKYAIPIKPKYHDLLFPEISPQISLGTGVPGNTIKKVYISQSKINELAIGSLIYFYRSSPEQYLTTIAVVERCRRMSDLTAIASAIGKRSVYSSKEIEEMVAENKEILIINFRLIGHFRKFITLKELVSSNIFSAAPQSITGLSEDVYTKLKDFSPVARHPFDIEMKLSPEPFAVTISGQKTLEVRIHDERRKYLKPGQIIRFVNSENGKEELFATVISIRLYSSLDQLVQQEDIRKTGGLYTDPNDWLEKLKKYYPDGGEGMAIEITKLNF